MKNYLLLTTITLLFTLLLTGCSDSKNTENDKEKDTNEVAEKNTTEKIKQDIPEPYIKAVKAINQKDWELMNTYLDLVISDFPNSDYVLPAQILKGIMQVSKLRATSDLSEIFISGIDNGISLYDEEDKTTLNRHLDLIEDTFEKYTKEQEETYTYIIQKFNLANDYSEYFKDITSLSLDSYSNHLSFYGDVGYPIPTDSEVEKFLNNYYGNNICFLLNTLTDKSEQLNYNYLPLFTNAGGSLYEQNSELAKNLFNLVLELTSDDIYNEYRISVNNILNDNNFENTQKSEPTTHQKNNEEEVEETTSNDSNYDAFEWGQGIKETFEEKMIQNEYADSKDNLIYKNGFIGDDNQGYYEVYTINENGEEQYIVVVNVKTGWYHG